ncbi:DUF6233 domain-containing protein [Streptomyces sp. NPDC001373]|uniref:DUF6233 domain-containing protein n=1 Tax=Streptomyces sp. NPDC001373 TaxID=3364565 RepID=UPI003677F1AA
MPGSVNSCTSCPSQLPDWPCDLRRVSCVRLGGRPLLPLSAVAHRPVPRPASTPCGFGPNPASPRPAQSSSAARPAPACGSRLRKEALPRGSPAPGNRDTPHNGRRRRRPGSVRRHPAHSLSAPDSVELLLGPRRPSGWVVEPLRRRGPDRAVVHAVDCPDAPSGRPALTWEQALDHAERSGRRLSPLCGAAQEQEPLPHGFGSIGDG